MPTIGDDDLRERMLHQRAIDHVKRAFALPSVEQAVIEVEAKLVADQLQEWLDLREEER